MLFVGFALVAIPKKPIYLGEITNSTAGYKTLIFIPQSLVSPTLF